MTTTSGKAELIEERYLDPDDGDFVTHEESAKIALKFINQHFKNPGKEYPTASIPADKNRDDDLRLMQYIRQCRKLQSDRDLLAREVRAWRHASECLVEGDVSSHPRVQAARAAVDEAGILKGGA